MSGIFSIVLITFICQANMARENMKISRYIKLCIVILFYIIIPKKINVKISLRIYEKSYIKHVF